MSVELKSHRSEGITEVAFMKGLLSAVIRDVSKLTDVKVSDVQRDVNYINNRLDTEGTTFGTTVLPQFSKALLSAFQSGRFTRPSAFKAGGPGALPAFLHGLTKRCFTDDGCLRGNDAVDSGVVWGIQQVCTLLKKYELPYSPHLVNEKYNNVKQVESELPKTFTTSSLDVRDRTVLALAREQVHYLLKGVDLRHIRPDMGPGSTAAGPMNRNQKMKLVLDSTLPAGYDGGMYGCILEYSGDNDGKNCTFRTWYHPIARVKYARCSKLIFVPKDSGGPRGIKMEPCQQMWIQQGQRLCIEKAANTRSRGRINYTDQSINANLALVGSKTGGVATLDMKDASYRVSLALVTELFADLDNVLPLLLASRSTHYSYITTDDDGTPLAFHMERLKMFAPMGSAVCFPVESIVFWALAVATMIERGYDPREVRDSIYVYGDDIICPTGYAEDVMLVMERFHLRFNRSKSFTSGPFRESCGTDAFMGDVVTPVKVKTLRPTTIDDVQGISAWVDYMNAFAKAWMWETSCYIEEMLKALGLSFVQCRGSFGILSAWTFSSEYPEQPRHIFESKNFKEYQSYQFWLASRSPIRLTAQQEKSLSEYHGYKVSGWLVKSRTKKFDDFDEEAGLFDWLTTRGELKDLPYEAVRGESTQFLKYGTVTIT